MIVTHFLLLLGIAAGIHSKIVKKKSLLPDEIAHRNKSESFNSKPIRRNPDFSLQDFGKIMQPDRRLTAPNKNYKTLKYRTIGLNPPQIYESKILPTETPIIVKIEDDSSETTRSDADIARKSRQRRRRNIGTNQFLRRDMAPQLRFTPIEQTVSPGTQVSIKCTAVGSPPPVISWTRDGRALSSSLRTNLGSFQTLTGEVVSQVNMSDVSPRDGGLFKCSARNRLGVDAHSARINVYGAPFVRRMSNMSFVAGVNAAIWCPAGGYPHPKVTWKYEGAPLFGNLRYGLMSNDSLIIREVRKSDEGRYSCYVRGRQGQTAMAHTYLHILKAPIIQSFSFPSEVEEGHRTQLSCMISSGDLPITITILKDGQHLQHDPNVELKRISDFSSVLLFKSLSERHSGEYTCVAANDASATNQTTTLSVKIPPKWVLEPSDLSVSIGSVVLLNCKSRGVPKPRVTWMKESGLTNPTYQTILEDGIRMRKAGNGSLMITSARQSDAGSYLCHADNGIEPSLSKSVRITINMGAVVLSQGGQIKAHSARTAMLECEARGDAPLAVVWEKNHKIITTSRRVTIREIPQAEKTVRSILELLHVHSQDAGEYVCKASNPHGSQSKTFSLVVLEPPTPPSNVITSDVTSRSAKISWTLPQAAAVTVQYKATNEASWSDHGRNVSVGEWTTAQMLSSLTPHTEYVVRLFAYNDLGTSSPSRTVIFKTNEEVPFGAPRDVRVVPNGSRSFLISWRHPEKATINGELRGFMISLRRQNFDSNIWMISRPVLRKGQDKFEEYHVRNLAPNALYEISVKAFNKVGAGPLSSPRIVQSTGQEAPDCPPTSISCKDMGTIGMRIWWEPPLQKCSQTPITGYTITATPTGVSSPHNDVSTWEINTTNLEKGLTELPPNSNVSLMVRSYNAAGRSSPSKVIFCQTNDEVPIAPQHLRVISVGESTVLALWSPPSQNRGKITHYTLYHLQSNQRLVGREIVDATGPDSTWRHIRNLEKGIITKVWVTASSMAGESSPSITVSVSTDHKSIYPPIVAGSATTHRVSMFESVTLGCRAFGLPIPDTHWEKEGVAVVEDNVHQILHQGELHVSSLTESTNYSCVAKNSVGRSSFEYRLEALRLPSPPTLMILSSGHSSVNLSVHSLEYGGLPVLGYKVYHRNDEGEWEGTDIVPSTSRTPSELSLRNLPCGSSIHLYATAWNSEGVSPPSRVVVASTEGSVPPRPNLSSIIEVNSSCITIRLYAWKENVCPLLHWKLEFGREEKDDWIVLRDNIKRDVNDIGLCDFASGKWHLLRLIAFSEAGESSVIYKVAPHDPQLGWVSSNPIQEILVHGSTDYKGWLDAHLIAGIISPLFLACAFVICICAVLKRRRMLQANKQTLQCDDDSEIKTGSRIYSSSPSKRHSPSESSDRVSSKRTYQSINSPYGDKSSDSYEVCPYATFSAGSIDETLEYGITLHSHSPTSKGVFEGSELHLEEVYMQGKNRSSRYPDSEIYYTEGKKYPLETPAQGIFKKQQKCYSDDIRSIKGSSKNLLKKNKDPVRKQQRAHSGITDSLHRQFQSENSDPSNKIPHRREAHQDVYGERLSTHHPPVYHVR